MPVPRRRHCPARRDRGRTHKKMSAPASLVVCPNEACGVERLPHRVCHNCGEFQGRFYGVKTKKPKPGDQQQPQQG